MNPAVAARVTNAAATSPDWVVAKTVGGSQPLPSSQKKL